MNRKFANGFLLIQFIITKTGNKAIAFTNNSFTMHNRLNWIKFLDKGAFLPAFTLHLYCKSLENANARKYYTDLERMTSFHSSIPLHRFGINQFSVRWIGYSVWFIKIGTTHNLSLWSYEYFLIILLYSRCPVPSTDQALPSCFCFRISWILMERHWKHFFGSCSFLQGLRS